MTKYEPRKKKKKEKKLKLPVDLLRASFSLVQYQRTQAVQRSVALKTHLRKRSLPARCHISIWKHSGGLKRSLLACADSLEGPKICASTCASAGDDPHIAATTASDRLQNKSCAPWKRSVTTRVGERFEIQTNVTTFKTADIFRNKSMSHTLTCTNTFSHCNTLDRLPYLKAIFKTTCLLDKAVFLFG